MSGGNWDTVALNERGERCSGTFTSVQGVLVRIYKNWIYISDGDAWQEDGPFDKPIIMRIDHGNVRYRDVQIVAMRGPQDGVYVIAWSAGPDSDFAGIVGCGVYGYDNACVFVGVQESSLKWFADKLDEKNDRDEYVLDVPGELCRFDLMTMKK